jgi:hypothetical protein
MSDNSFSFKFKIWQLHCIFIQSYFNRLFNKKNEELALAETSQIDDEKEGPQVSEGKKLAETSVNRA